MPMLTLPDGRSIGWDRPRIMGILNATPDSFSDGGRWLDAAAAVRHGLAMAEQGADVIDVGGESTRPGSQRVEPAEQVRRVVPVIRGLAQALRTSFSQVAISIDTTSSAVAAAALDAGAVIVNDVSAGRDDPAMLPLAAQRRTPIILMHMRGQPATMQDDPRYGDVVAEVLAFLLDRAAVAERAGVARTALILDPGIGFGKTREHNLALLAALPRFVASGYPVLLGTSRKRFMGSLCKPAGGAAPAPAELVGATCATTALGVAAGVALFRVHDVTPNRQTADVAWAIGRASDS